MASNETLSRKRGAIKAKLTAFNKFVNTCVDKEVLTDEEREMLKQRINRAGFLLNDFEDIQIQIEIAATDVNKKYEEREAFEESFYKDLAQASVILKRFEPINEQTGLDDTRSANLLVPGISASSAATSGLKLPTIELPKFNGEFKQWLEYKDTFLSLIHNNSSISNIQKYHYLKSSLEGTASQMIRSLELSEKNYIIAWDTLCERFDNNRLLIHNHVKALFDIESISEESSVQIRKLLDNINKNLHSLEQLNQPVDKWDTLVIYMITLKLDNVTLREWDKYKSGKESPVLEDLKNFLKARADLLETLEINNVDKRYGRSQNNSRSFLANKTNCVVCNKEHYIYSCPEFLKLKSEERCSRAKELKLCINCLRAGHFYRQCRLATCKKCNSKHHSLLHIDKADSGGAESDTIKSNTAKETVTSLTACGVSNYVFLSTAYIHIRDETNKVWTVRALLDCGSQSSFICEDLFKRLKLKGLKTNICITGLNQSSSEINSYCFSKVSSMHNAFDIRVKLFVIPEITSGSLPNIHVDVKDLNIPPNIRLADPTFYKPGKIEVLIGADLFWQLLCVGQKSLGPNKPILQKTKFGWVVSGQIDSQVNESVWCNFAQAHDDIQEQLKRFWEIEECIAVPPLSKEELACEENFIKNMERDASGRFIVSIPLKESPSKLGESYTQAHRRFISLEKRLQRDLKLKDMYTNFMLEYLSLGHMDKVEKLDENELNYYMPHHCVIRNDSLTTKLRVVFDASAPTSTGLSLNHIQMKGPTIQDDLFSILLRFRKYEIVIAADMEKMYRQVLIKPEQRCLQKILWRSNPDSDLETFNLNTVTYETTSASFLAERCVNQLAIEHEKRYPDAANSIKSDFYVDDWLSGTDTVENAKSICLSMSKILETGGFHLRKFYSNEPRIFESISSNESDMTVINFGHDENTKTLGLMWSPCMDKLMYKITIHDSFKITKRSVLSVLSQVFDPLGLLSPCIIVGKILIQKLWLEKLSWDESLPQNLHTQWLEFKNELPLINKLRIQRKVICSNPVKIELHGFADASEKAYGACIYLRTISKDEKVFTHLLCAKSKVAPLKAITIPKLELCAALLLARLVEKARISLKSNIDNCVLWTDSTIVIHWLKTAPNSLKPFVGNRVAEITQLTDQYIWKYVPSQDNPADAVSRGVSPSKILSFNLWWYGPSWLQKGEEFWPKTKLKEKIDIPEIKKVLISTKSANNHFLISNFSTLRRLKRICVYLYRFRHNCLNKDNKFTGILSIREIENSFLSIIKLVQNEVFSEEIDCLKKGKQLKPNNKLKCLNPFLDKEKVIRVGGRINNSDFMYSKMHPIIMPKDHHLLKLIFLAEHERLLHAGPSLLLASVREKFWPIGGRNLARKTVRHCTICFRYNARTIQPIMGNLPSERLKLTVPFNTTGVDFAGPFILIDRKGRGCKTFKAYISLFICFSVKAIHVELVTELSKDAFVQALRRFISRRGLPSKIFSDNGTNFVATNNELKQLGQFLLESSSQLKEAFIKESVDWEFIPPHSPHFGGLWEAGVKSVKHHLKRVTGSNIFTYEEFNTLIVQIEGILNSRPLCPLSSNPSDLSSLTPSHFLIGRFTTSLPEEDLKDVPENRLSRFQHLQLLRRHFWERWNKEFISELQVRQKWKENKEELQPDSLVLIKEDHLSPMKWRLGRVISVCPGKDGVSRVAVVKTQSGDIKRSFAKICPLPKV